MRVRLSLSRVLQYQVQYLVPSWLVAYSRLQYRTVPGTCTGINPNRCTVRTTVVYRYRYQYQVLPVPYRYRTVIGKIQPE